MTGNVEKLREIIRRSKRIVFFGGAGVSTASGIPDFRSETGLFAQEENGLSPEMIRAELTRGRGTQFDPQIVDIMLRLIEEGKIDLNAIYGTIVTETKE